MQCYNSHGRTLYSTTRLLELLRRTADAVGHTPTIEEMRAYGIPSYGTYRRAFGSMPAAMQRAGLAPRAPSTKVSPDSGRKVKLIRNRQMVTGGYYQAVGVRHWPGK